MALVDSLPETEYAHNNGQSNRQGCYSEQSRRLKVKFRVYALNDKQCLGTHNFEEEPILGSLLQDNPKQVIAGVHLSAPRKVFLMPRVSISPEKPFMSFDWHLGLAFCAKCVEWAKPIQLVECDQFCPHCGPLDEQCHCIDTNDGQLKFNHVANEHPCVCEHDCARYDDICDICMKIPASGVQLAFILAWLGNLAIDNLVAV